MKEVKLTGRKQWKIPWFKYKVCNSRNEWYIKGLAQHVVRILVIVIVAAIVIKQNSWMKQNMQYLDMIPSINRNFEMKMNGNQVC